MMCRVARYAISYTRVFVWYPGTVRLVTILYFEYKVKSRYVIWYVDGMVWRYDMVEFLLLLHVLGTGLACLFHTCVYS